MLYGQTGHCRHEHTRLAGSSAARQESVSAPTTVRILSGPLSSSLSKASMPPASLIRCLLPASPANARKAIADWYCSSPLPDLSHSTQRYIVSVSACMLLRLAAFTLRRRYCMGGDRHLTANQYHYTDELCRKHNSSALQQQEALALTAGGLITRQSTFVDRTSSDPGGGSVK